VENWRLSLLFVKKSSNQENEIMTSKGQDKKPSYVFRGSWALLLLAVNFLVAAYYFHIIE
jgi:photosystem I protein